MPLDERLPDVDSDAAMAGMDCGTISSLVWPALQDSIGASVVTVVALWCGVAGAPEKDRGIRGFSCIGLGSGFGRGLALHEGEQGV
jgi:hypothetical protein